MIYLCYECGSMLEGKEEYDVHVLAHQAKSICYQLYEFEKDVAAKKAGNYRRKQFSKFSFLQPARRQDMEHTSIISFRQKNRLHDGVKNRFSRDSPKRYVQSMHNTVGKDSKENTGMKPAVQEMLELLEKLSNSAPHIEKKKASGDEIQRSFNGMETKVHDEAYISAVASSFKNEAIASTAVSKEAKIEKKNCKSELTKCIVAYDDRIAGKAVASPILDNSFAKTSKESGSELKPGKRENEAKQESAISVPMDASAKSVSRLSPGVTMAMIKCFSCDYRSNQGTDMVEHAVHAHKIPIVKLEKTDFVDGKPVLETSLEAEQSCRFCGRVLENETDYFLHIVVCHKGNLVSPGINRYSCVVHLAHPTGTQLVRINIVRPQSPVI